ncbi:MAG TPA: sodium:solute symporter family protein [Opitutaceae bacterium]|nr:sodium:solute symporter family protein [Opitutaceae bacterium]
MTLTVTDWIIVFATLGVCFAASLVVARRGGKDTSEYFTSGRAAPWWLIGLSMVATTFSADTPNLVTDIVRRNGVAGNWVWWAFLLTGMSTVFIYARLWRRSGVLTDLEFYELRYSGKPASAVRGFRAVYLGLCFNLVTTAAVHLAAVKIAGILLGWTAAKTLVICGVLCIVFSVPSGLWGVLVVDAIQFGIAMAGSIGAAIYVLRLPQVGGLENLMAKIEPWKLSFVPSPSQGELFTTLLVVPLAIQWWSVWYPGSEPGGGSYIAQRMLAARTERDALKGTLFFNAAHYALRPWPWIIVALASIVVFPKLEDIRAAFPHLDPHLINHDVAYPAMLTFMPHGFAGIVVAGLAAAYISTIITHLNWGTSYLVHDCYRRFIRPDASERHYVWMGRATAVMLMVASGLLVGALDSAKQTFDLMLSIGAGTGLLYLLRWFWWRINAWTEIAAMASSFVFACIFNFAPGPWRSWQPNTALVVSVAATTATWLTVAFLSKPTDAAVLRAFYEKIRPAGPGWNKLRVETGLPASSDSLPQGLLAMSLGAIAIWSLLFGIGACLMSQMVKGGILLVISTIAAIGTGSLLKRNFKGDH